MQGLDTNSYSSSACKSPNNCKGNCQCGANDGTLVKVIESRTTYGRTKKTKTYHIGKPSMNDYTGN